MANLRSWLDGAAEIWMWLFLSRMLRHGTSFQYISSSSAALHRSDVQTSPGATSEPFSHHPGRHSFNAGNNIMLRHGLLSPPNWRSSTAVTPSFLLPTPITHVSTPTATSSSLYHLPWSFQRGSEFRLLDHGVSIVRQINIDQSEKVVQHLRIFQTASSPILVHTGFVHRLSMIDLLV